MQPLSQNTAPWLLLGNKGKPKKKPSNKVGVLVDFNKVTSNNHSMKPLENMCMKFKSSMKQNPDPPQKTAQIAIQTTIYQPRQQAILTDKPHSKPTITVRPPSPALSQDQILQTDHTSDINSVAGDSNVSRRVNTKYSKANLKARPSSALQQRHPEVHIQKPPPQFKLKHLFLDDAAMNIVSKSALGQRDSNNTDRSEVSKDNTIGMKRNPIFQRKQQGPSRISSNCKENVSNDIYSRYSPNVAPIQIKRQGKNQTTLELPLHMVKSIHSQQIRDNINFWELKSIKSKPPYMDQFQPQVNTVKTKDCFTELFNEFCK